MFKIFKIILTIGILFFSPLVYADNGIGGDNIGGGEVIVGWREEASADVVRPRTIILDNNTIQQNSDGSIRIYPATSDLVKNLVSNVAYASSWDSVTTIAPSKNAVYDKIETISGGDITSVGDVVSGAAFDGTQGTTLTFNNVSGDQTISFDNTTQDFEFSNDITITDATPHFKLIDTTAAEDDFEFYADGNQAVITNATDLIDLVYFTPTNTIKLLRDTTFEKDLIHEFSRSIGIENLAAADDNVLMGSWTNNVTITKVGCHYVGTGTTPATIALEDGSGNAMTHATCACVATGTDITFVAVTANNTLNIGEALRFDVTNAVSPETDEYEVTISYTE